MRLTTFSKVLITGNLIMVTTFITISLIKAGYGNYFLNASPITSGLLVTGWLISFYLFYVLIRKFWSMWLIALIPFWQSCNYAKSNQQVVVSEDCGMAWKLINAGDAVPKGVGNPCFMKVVIPNFPMQGDSKFISNLKDRVRASIHIDYDYSITNPLAFIKQAKYLGKANTDADSGSALDTKAFEGAENMVIDKRIRDVSKALFLEEDIVELDQAEIENRLQAESNKVLEPLGVHLNFITLTFDLDEQTRQAIDISTAMKIYESKGLTDVGKQVMISRAGATKITIEQKPAAAQVAE